VGFPKQSSLYLGFGEKDNNIRKKQKQNKTTVQMSVGLKIHRTAIHFSLPPLRQSKVSPEPYSSPLLVYKKGTQNTQ